MAQQNSWANQNCASQTRATSKTVTKIPAKHTTSKHKLRVAAYCRTSTRHESQQTSILNQCAHYRDLICANPAWELAGIYCEQGASGTRASTRPELQRLVSDCHAGRVDMVITKSISRLARNTADCLAITRQLVSLGVVVRFESEGIQTNRTESELILSVLAAIAQDESRSLSQTMKWGIRKRFEAGTYMPPRVPYGYRKSDGTVVVHPAEAKVVRGIFYDLANGATPREVANKLTQRGIATWTQANHASGREGVFGTAAPGAATPVTAGAWRASTVRSMATNLFYTGDCLYQKTYTDESFARHKNTGQRDTFLHCNHHPALIDHELFVQVGAMLTSAASTMLFSAAAGGRS